MPESEKERQRKWEVENAVYTLLKAIEIKKDKKLMSAAQKAMKKKQMRYFIISLNIQNT